MARWQLLLHGLSSDAIQHRLETGRLHGLWPGVYAVGRPDVGRLGTWMAAVLACGEGASLSHESAAALWGIRDAERGTFDVSVPAARAPRGSGIRVHRRAALGDRDLTRRSNIPVTSPICTLVDIAAYLPLDAREAAVSQADLLRLVDPETLRRALDRMRPRPGVAVLRATLDRRTFRLTRSKLERLLIPLALAAGLPRPLTRQIVNGFEVDFHWPELGLVVETDGLTYHRTPAQQAEDRLRDQAHAAAGLTVLRFTHAQVAFEPDHVTATLAAVAARLAA